MQTRIQPLITQKGKKVNGAAQHEKMWCLEKSGYSFKIKACSKFYHRHLVDIPRKKF